MNATRIEVPLSLPEPHFEDEATVVSARQVVPLDQVRSHDRRRKVLAFVSVLFAAILCGALGAFTVNYFEQRSNTPTVSQPATISINDEQRQPAAEPTPTNNADALPETSEEPAGAVATATPTPETPETREPKSDQTLASAKKPTNPPDPKLLVRQRRVHPPSDQPGAGQNDAPKPRGAARIQDIFSGPNQ